MLTAEPTFSVSELGEVISMAMARAFPDQVWVAGEIRDLARARSGHVYFSLVDATPDGSAVAARLPVVLFASDRDAVNRLLVRSGAVRMTDGVRIRIRCRVGFYAGRGELQLQMTWIDPAYTLGQLEAARRELMQRLDAEGLLGANASLAPPLVPLRVGVVTSRGSAAHADFVDELRRSGFGFTVSVADARVQGVDAAASVVAALEALAGRGLDLLAVVRGGGARTDLAAFDDERVARAIAACPVPVWTGIGHEIDTSVADAVAARSLKTPTACAAELVAEVETFVTGLDHAARRVTTAATSGLARAGTFVESTAHRLSGSTHRRLGGAVRRADLAAHTLQRGLGMRWAREADRYEQATARLERESRRALADAERRLAHVDGVVRAVDPVRTLARGWTLTRDSSGLLVRTPLDVSPGDAITTETAGGRITSVVEAATMESDDRA